MKINQLFFFLLILLISCKLKNRHPEAIYSSKEYQLYPDRVVQGKYTAQALSDTKITSNYFSPLNRTYSRNFRFKFSINGQDNELPKGVYHHLFLKPDSTKEINSPLLVFGKPEPDTLPALEKDYLEPNTILNIKLDMRPVLRDFKNKGFHTLANGERITANEFLGVYICGTAEPLSRDFENLADQAEFQLKDFSGDSIYEISLLLNPFHPLDREEKTWNLQSDLSKYPKYRSDQLLIDALYNLSLEELIKNIRPDSTFMAGEDWNSIWTRDIAYSTHLALALIEPELAKASLMKRIKDERIIQDSGTGGSWPISTDRISWILAAWEIFLFTGDMEWLRSVYPVILNSIRDDLKIVTNHDNGLMQGESTFLNSQSQSYPLWMEPADIYESQSLSTNALYFRVFQIISEMMELMGEPGIGFQQLSQELGTKINQHLWIPKKGYYGQYLYGRFYFILSPRSESLGEAFTVLFGVSDQKKSQVVISNTPVTKYGVPCIFPQIPEIPPYHNNAIWPFVQAYWTWSAATTGHLKAVEFGLASIYRPAALFLTNKENFTIKNGDYQGTKINSDRQLWSIAGNLAMIYRVFFGMEFSEEGLRFHPTVPKSFKGEKHLSNFKYKNATLDISLTGFGTKIKSITLDGEPLKEALIVNDLNGPHKVNIELEESSISKQKIHLVENDFTSLTPDLTKTSTGIQWKRLDKIMEFLIYKNGNRLERTTKNHFKTRDEDKFNTYQLSATNLKGYESYLSLPILKINEDAYDIFEAEEVAPTSDLQYTGFSGQGFVALSNNLKEKVIFKIKIPSAGEYLIDFRYSNGNGALSAGNTCGIRTLMVNGKYTGAVVFPNRGYQNWSDWGYTNSIKTWLEEGENSLEL
ncbi:glycogen debranching protein, partial [Xanthovirga aplysinae]|uniref:glycogen debranching protein n=1 Tax=Xanthovirga aplysinae TaxID=2529853 RepID=UPI0012BCD20F